MKRFLAIVPLAVLVLSCDDDTSTPPPPKPVTTTAYIRDADYIADKYFYFADPRAYIGPRIIDAHIEVFMSMFPIEIGQGIKIPIPGWAIPDSVGDGQAIRDAADVIKVGGLPNGVRSSFELLTYGTDYDFIRDPQTNLIVGVAIPYIGLLPAVAHRALAVRYVNEFNQAVGGDYRSLGIADSDSLMLKMLRAPDPHPHGLFGSVWRLMIRNVYNVGFTNIDPDGLKVSIEDVLNPTRTNRSTPEGSTVPYLRIFGLDMTDADGSGPPDGKIDLTLGNFDLINGILVLPDVRPFAPDPANVEQWTDSQFAFTEQYQAQYDISKNLYDRILTDIEAQESHQYVLKVSVTIPAQ
jgi:hypothetical protein